MSAPDYEKGVDHGITHDASSTEASPVYKSSAEAYQGVGFWTRMGCTPESFKRRTLEDKHNQLSQILKKRHLHMIAVSEKSHDDLLIMQLIWFSDWRLDWSRSLCWFWCCS
jgi:hypothetical protein